MTTEYQSVVSAFNKYQTDKIRQNAYSKTFDVYRLQFGAGSITAVDLLQQQNNYISVLNDYIQSKYEFILKRKILDVYYAMLNSDSGRKIISNISDDRILIETDSPFTSINGQIFKSSYIEKIVEEIADLRNIKDMDMQYILWNNFSRLIKC